MSRWQPPHPAKTIVTKNENVRDFPQPLPWRYRCCWPNCLRKKLDGIPLCEKHLYEAVDYERDHETPTKRAVAYTVARANERREKEQLKQERIIEATKRLPSGYNAAEGTVYYILVGEHIKIGFTKNMNRRILAYPPASMVLGVERGGKELERQRHKQFEAHRALGREWFVDHAEIRAHIAENCLQWTSLHKPSVGPSGPARAKIGPKYGTWDSRWKAS